MIKIQCERIQGCWQTQVIFSHLISSLSPNSKPWTISHQFTIWDMTWIELRLKTWDKKTRKVRWKIQEHKVIKHEVNKGHHNRCPTLNPNTTINDCWCHSKKRKTIQPCIDISRKKTLHILQFVYISSQSGNWIGKLCEKKDRDSKICRILNKSPEIGFSSPFIFPFFTSITSKYQASWTNWPR